jgi:hemerythrin superfamily protein
MATKKTAKRSAKKPSAKKSSTRTLPLALEMLAQDHAAVDKLFRRYSRTADDEARAEVVTQICEALTLHAHIEEEIFYPEVRNALEAHDLLDEAEVEHGSIKALVDALSNGQPGEDLFDAQVTVLKEYVAHHVKEEEEELFPKVKRSGLDLQDLGERMSAAKSEFAGDTDLDGPNSGAMGGDASDRLAPDGIAPERNSPSSMRRS